MKSNRTPHVASWFLLVALGGALAACEESRTVAPASPIGLEVTPSGTVELAAGDTLRLRVTVQNASNPAISFRSTADTIASVNDAGLVTALRAGTATIIVASVVDPSRREALVVRVTGPPPLGDSLASVGIVDVLDPATGRPLARDGVRGRALVRLDFTPGPASRLEVLASDSVVCFRTFGGPSTATAPTGRSASAIPFDCVLDTAHFDSLSGAVAFPNGPLAVSARLVGAAGVPLAASQPATLVLANPDTLLARISAPKQALDAEGLQWIDGPLSVSAIPVLYGATSAIARATFTYRAPAGESISLTDAEAPFSVVIPEGSAPASGGLLGVTDDSLRVVVATAVRGGAAGPRATTQVVRYDNEIPSPGGLLGREWVGAETSFQALYDPASATDAGVGRISARFFVGSPTAEPAAIVAAGREVIVGGDLPEAGVGTYRVAALVCDALANCALLGGFSFGVDRGTPAISGASFADRTINPAQDLSVSVSDNLSGFGERFLQASVTVLDASPATASCGPVVEDIDLPGREVGGACAPDTVAVIRTPRTAPGYYTYRIAPLDQARNLGEAITRTVLVDRTPPTIESLSSPAQLTPGRPVTVEAVVRDDLDLLSVSAHLVYPSPAGARLALPFAFPDTAGVPFDAELVTRFAASLSFPFVGTLTYPDEGRLAGASTFAADSLRVQARNVARLVARQGRALASPAPNGNPFSSVDSVAASLNLQNICTARCLGTDPTSATLTARMIGPTGFRNPFAEGGRVYFFQRDSTGATTLVGSATSAPQSETGDRRIFSYSITVRPEAGLAGDVTLFAVGTTVAGNGLLIGDVRLHLFGR